MLAAGETDDGRADVRVIERQGRREDEHFTEGEPDLEPPEELAVAEIDEESLLEEDLESQVDLEDEVDEDVLETSLDHLVHDADDDDADDEDDVATSSAPVALGAVVSGDADLDDLEIEDLEDREESLDRLLAEKLAGDEESLEPQDDTDDIDVPDDGAVGATGVPVPSCGPDEFVCPSCFLVRHVAQRVGASGSLCHDCGE
jgi:hypothetical protein